MFSVHLCCLPVSEICSNIHTIHIDIICLSVIICCLKHSPVLSWGSHILYRLSCGPLLPHPRRHPCTVWSRPIQRCRRYAGLESLSSVIRIIWFSLLVIFRVRVIYEDFLIFKTIHFDFTKVCVNLVHILLGKIYTSYM